MAQNLVVAEMTLVHTKVLAVQTPVRRISEDMVTTLSNCQTYVAEMASGCVSYSVDLEQHKQVLPSWLCSHNSDTVEELCSCMWNAVCHDVPVGHYRYKSFLHLPH